VTTSPGTVRWHGRMREAAKCLEAGNPEKQCQETPAGSLQGHRSGTILWNAARALRLFIAPTRVIDAQDYGCTPDTSRPAGVLPRGCAGAGVAAAQAPAPGPAPGMGLPIDPQLLNDLPELKVCRVMENARTGQVRTGGQQGCPSVRRGCQQTRPAGGRLQGYMLPITAGEKHSHFLLTMRPPHCPFCLSSDRSTFVEVKVEECHQAHLRHRWCCPAGWRC